MSALAHCAGPRAHVALTLFELDALAKALSAVAEAEIERHLAARFERLRQSLLASAAEGVPALFDDGENEEPENQDLENGDLESEGLGDERF